MLRSDRLTLADAALERAAACARDAEVNARRADRQHRAEPLAAVGALWAEIARTHTALADTTEA